MKSLKERIRLFLRTAVSLNDEVGNEPRRVVILNILLFSAIFLSFVAALTIIVDPDPSAKNISVTLRTIFDGFLFFLFLRVLSLSGRISLASRVFSFSYFIIATLMALLWGVNVPQALLFYALSIITSSILVGSRFAFFITSLIVVSFPSIFLIHRSGIFKPDISWRTTQTVAADLFIYVASLVVIFVVSWLYNREIKKALWKARESEEELKKERDLLELRVEERTSELKKEHLERIGQLSRFVEFGKLSSGIFHDLANHLNALLLMMDEKMIKESAEVSRARDYLDEFRRARNDLEKFIASNKRRLREVSYAYFSPDSEIEALLKLFLRSAEKSSVSIEFLPGAAGESLSGSQTKFGHIVTNLIANAVESYDDSDKKPEDKKVIINTVADGGFFTMEVRDFGCGIPENDRKKIFDPFYTTKPEDKGTGLGLTIVKETVENDFGGEIFFDSHPDGGSVFTIKIPTFNINVRSG